MNTHVKLPDKSPTIPEVGSIFCVANNARVYMRMVDADGYAWFGKPAPDRIFAFCLSNARIVQFGTNTEFILVTSEQDPVTFIPLTKEES